MVLKNAGLGESNQVIRVENSGKATTIYGSLKNDCPKDSCKDMRILGAGPELEDFVKNTSSKDRIIYTNCEGCEIAVLESLLDTGAVTEFKYIHFATHFVNTQIDYCKRLCKIRQRLSITHDFIIGLDYAQERYVRHIDAF